MTSLHTRHRRLLSADRRLGAQGSADALAGRAQRHALGWRDCTANDADSPMPMLDRALIAIGLLIATWSLIVGAVFAVVWLID